MTALRPGNISAAGQDSDLPWFHFSSCQWVNFLFYGWSALARARVRMSRKSGNCCLLGRDMLNPDRVALLFLVAASASAQVTLATQSAVWSARPDAAAFEKVENDRLAVAERYVERIVSVKGARTIANTLEPYDEATRELHTAAYLAGLMQQVHPDTAFRDRATEMTRKVSSAITALSLNRQAFDALSALDLSHADPATRYFVQRQLLEYRLSGVDHDEATRARLHN